MSERLEADDVRRDAAGRWLEILTYICPGMFDQAIKKLGQHVTCPFHGGAEDFRFVKVGKKGRGNTADCGVAMCTCGFYADGFKVIERATGMRFGDILVEVDEYLNGPAHLRAPVKKAKPVIQNVPKEDPEKNAKIKAKNAKLWDGGKVFSQDTTPYYLQRGISPEALAGLQDVRVSDSVPYFVPEIVKIDGRDVEKMKRVGNFPMIQALMRCKSSDPVAIHRTWLSRDRKGKAPVPKAKKLTETTGAAGAAIRLHDASDATVLGLSEGIETALSARTLSYMGYWPELEMIPVWACYSERNIRNFEVPIELLATLKKIIIFSDHDKNGIGFAAALAFQARAAFDYPHLDVEIRIPPSIGDDWNDELVRCLKAVDRTTEQASIRAQEAITAARTFVANAVADPQKLVYLVKGYPSGLLWNEELVRCLAAVDLVKYAVKESVRVAVAI